MEAQPGPAHLKLVGVARLNPHVELYLSLPWQLIKCKTPAHQIHPIAHPIDTCMYLVCTHREKHI